MATKESDEQKVPLNKDPNTTDSESEDDKKTDSKTKRSMRSLLKVAQPLIIYSILVLLVGLSTLHITRFAYTFVPCDHPLTNDNDNDNLTEHSGSYEAQAAADKPVDYHQRYLHFSNLVYVWSSLFHWIEYAYLFYGFRCFIRTALKWPDELYSSIIDSTKEFVLKPKSRTIAVGIVFSFVLFTIVSLLIPLVGLFHDTGEFHQFKCQLAPKVVVYLYHFFTLIVFIITVLVRLMMVLATSTCGAVWLEMEMTQEELNKLAVHDGNVELKKFLKCSHKIRQVKCDCNCQLKEFLKDKCFRLLCCFFKDEDQSATTQRLTLQPNKDEDQSATTLRLTLQPNKDEDQSATTLRLTLQPNNGKDWDEAVKRYYKYMMEYETKLEVIAPIYDVFCSWFVIQWIIYLVSLIIDLSRLVRPWFNNYAADSLLLSRTALDCVFDILALTSSYLAALKMNSYLRRYIRRLQAAQVKEAKDCKKNGSMMQYTLCQTQLSITMIPKSHFLPRIPGFGVNISLQGPGFILGTIITIIGLVASLSSF